tara:strand:- start:750 stop:1118 length:369 start_codon:yes stop_codon:yes gene_type:complete
MPLTLGYSSSYGVVANAYHVLTDFFVVSGSDPNTTVSGSLWIDSASYQADKEPLVKYTFTFNCLEGTPAVGKTPAAPQPDIFSQSYAALQTINVGTGKSNPNNFVDNTGKTPEFDFRSAVKS